MNQQFCLSCNKPTAYLSSPPRHCSHCGKLYIDSSASTVPNKKVPELHKGVVFSPSTKTGDDEDGETFTGLDGPITISNLQYETESLRPNRERVKLPISNKEVPINETRAKKPGRQPKANQINKKMIEQQWAAKFKNNTRGNE